RPAAAAAEAVAAAAAAPRRAPGAPVLSVDRLVVRSDRGHVAVQDVALHVGAGEIVGVAGVAGNGQRELADAIAGLRPAGGGRVEIGGADVTRASVRARVSRGLGYVPEDRLTRGVAAGLPLDDNLIMRRYWRAGFRRGPFLSRRAVASWVAEQRERVEIRGVRDGVRVSILSGGNVQRAILARELADETRLLIACSPSRGLDVGVTASVRGMLRARSEQGLGVLLISEDLDELTELSDRILVMYAGRIVGEVSGSDADPERLGLLMTGSGGPS
ncbi:MAG TPA: ATP-binding cassette domain-containing protein, partial [Conexibacter sp.]|nr:ATP-binding cassette domain-containing protein [Conexibacter sp.]